LTVGFNMHPRWAFGRALPGFLEPLRAAGLRALEFKLDAHKPDWQRFPPLMADCQGLGFSLCFHAPHQAPYTITGFAQERREQIQALYAPMLDIAARFAPATVVVHGAKGAEGCALEPLRADTVAFLEWALGRYPGLTLALENLVPVPGRPRVGLVHAELLQIVAQLDDRRLGVCWDMGHDARIGHVDVPGVAWLRTVVHTHVHDIDENGMDHCPLLHGRVPYRAWLPALARSGFRGTATLEINGERLAHLAHEQVKRVLTGSIAEIARLLTPSGGPT
jgi:sugar phosphate isomerase/epimerase